MPASGLGNLLDGAKVVFFDFGDTLVSLRAPLEVWVATASELGIRVRRDALRDATAAADKEYKSSVYEYRGRMEEFWKLYDGFVIKRLGFTDRGGRFGTAVEAAFLDTKRWMSVFPETHTVLSNLKRQGLILGIISNNTDDMLDRLNDLDLLRYFDSLTYSQEAGAEKPAPEPFVLALRRVRKKPEQCVHVGNSLEQDVAGAKGVGIRPILVDREGSHPNPGCAVVRDLRGLLEEA